MPNCGEAGVLGALCGVIGSLQPMETLKCLLGLGESLRGQLLTYGALDARFQTLNLPRDPDCPLCGRAPTIRELRDTAATCPPPAGNFPVMNTDPVPLEVSVEQAKSLLDADPTVLLIDVREPFECDICRLERSTAIPLQQLPKNLAALPRDRRILVHCHHGGRSLRATQFLRTQGFPAVSNVAGGIDA